MSLPGTKPTSGHVSFLVAIEGNADIAWTGQNRLD
jgi:hypothetical protein